MVIQALLPSCLKVEMRGRGFIRQEGTKSWTGFAFQVLNGWMLSSRKNSKNYIVFTSGKMLSFK